MNDYKPAGITLMLDLFGSCINCTIKFIKKLLTKIKTK